jgi:hypothetical protein
MVDDKNDEGHSGLCWWIESGEWRTLSLDRGTWEAEWLVMMANIWVQPTDTRTWCSRSCRRRNCGPTRHMYDTWGMCMKYATYGGFGNWSSKPPSVIVHIFRQVWASKPGSAISEGIRGDMWHQVKQLREDRVTVRSKFQELVHFAPREWISPMYLRVVLERGITLY